MSIVSWITRRWTTLSRTRKILGAVVVIFGLIGTIIAKTTAAVQFLADPPDQLRVYLDRYLPGAVDTMHSGVCMVAAPTHSITPGPLASCDPGIVDHLVSDPCADFDFVSDNKPGEADDPAAKTDRQAAKSRLLATRVCRVWAQGAGKPFEGTAESVLKAMASVMPECFGSGKSLKGKPAFWLRTTNPNVCGAHARVGSDRNWQVTAEQQTFFCLDSAPAVVGPSNPRDCNAEEIGALGLPADAAR
jgi:hypothetical protein